VTTVSTPLHGRETELARLRELVAVARAGSGAALVVEGDAGLGKSALLARLRGELDGALVVAAAGSEAESVLPFAGLDALLRPLLPLRRLLPDVQATALEAAFSLGPDAAAHAYAVGAATLSLLAAGAEEQPVVCLVDDAQWLDPPSLAALAFAARRLHTEPVAMVFAARTGDGAQLAIPDVEVLALTPLSRGAARALLGDRVAADVAEEIVAAADGNPLVLRELAARLDRAQLEGRDALVGPLPPHQRAEALFSETIAALDTRACRALVVLAAAGDTDVRLLASALAGAGGRLEDLEAAESAGLLKLLGGRVELAHPLVRSVAYHRAAPDAQRRAHAVVARALAPGDPRRAWHLAAAATRPDEDIAAQLDERAADARRRGGYASAARAQRRAADLTPDDDARARRLLDAADDFDIAGAVEEAVKVVDEAAALDMAAATASRVRGHRAHLRLVQGQPAAARDALVTEASALESAAPVSAARYLLEASLATMLLGDGEGWRELSGRALALVGQRDEPTRRVAVAMHAAARIGSIGDPRDPFLADALAMVEQLHARPEPIGGALEVYGVLAHTLVWIERFDDADRLLTRLIDDARALHVLIALPYLLSVRALLEFRLGHWSASAATAGEAATLAELTRGRSFLAEARAVQAIVEGWRGEQAACREHAHAALALAAEAGPRLAAGAHYALATAATVANRPDEALEQLRAAVAVHAGSGLVAAGSDLWQADLVEALIRMGDAQAAAAAATLEDQARASGCAGPLAAALRCRALLAPDDHIDAAFAAALDAVDRVPLPLERARILLCQGERLRRARRRAEARTPLRAALEIFEQLGAAGLAARARKELRATGGMVPERVRPEHGELTPHELQVALMVAQGRTNREVAGALFLAPKTVEHHLSAIYRKLGVRRRGELAPLFAHELIGS
jgi:DNA-binding CsgD family transcriptional regulator